MQVTSRGKQIRTASRLYVWKDELVQKKILARAIYGQIKYKIIAKQK